MKKEIVFLNGKFIPQEEARLSLLTPGALYGWGLFETMRSYKNRIVYLDQHLTRIKNSSKLLDIGLGYLPARLKKAIQETVKINGLKDAYVRLTAWKASGKKADVLINAKIYKPLPARKYKRGFSCLISNFKQNENSFLARLKTTNYLFYQLAYSEVQEKGFDEAIILNHSGHLSEASHSNLFMGKNNELFTPALECGCLEGITRMAILDLARKQGIKIHEGNFTLQDLYAADEAFLTNSLAGVMPVRSVENITIAKAKAKSSLTSFFIQKYKFLLKNGS